MNPRDHSMRFENIDLMRFGSSNPNAFYERSKIAVIVKSIENVALYAHESK